ncbi:hypothetical protein [Paenibacillus abyssi]|nr:hypothetical protein [Paenibacillus abyssi]
MVSYATARFYKSQKKLRRSALQYGVDQVIPIRDKDLASTSFYEKNKKILQQPRGGGYWLWKPYIIFKAMSKAKENDMIIYSDSGMEVIRPLDPLIDICKRQGGIMLFRAHNLLNKAWTKRDCFALMKCDSEDYWNAEQLMGSFCLFMNNQKNKAFVKEWLTYCLDERILTDIANQCGLNNFPEFKDHRHDQSVLSLLAVKHKIEVYRAPCQHGDRYKIQKFRHAGECSSYAAKPYKNSPYGTLLNHHRKKD